MGWDAFSSATRDWIPGTCTIANEEIREAFKKSMQEVSMLVGSVDGGLDCGALDLSSCARMIERLTGRNAWDENEWSPDFCQKMNDRMQLVSPDEVEKENLMYYWSVRKFFEVCAKHNLSIRFSW